MASNAVESQSLERQLRFACGELNRRLRQGEDCSSEGLLETFPGLTHEPELALELIYTEFLVRQQLQQAPDPEQFYARFPHWKADLRQLFEVHEAVCEEELSASRRSGDSTSEAPRRAARGESTDSPLSGHRRVGNYELLEEIGRGGMGVVYRARQIGLNRIVAVKMTLAGELASPGERSRFRNEAESAARLQHPGIVQIHEVGSHDGLPYFSMEYVEGGNLQSYLASVAADDESARESARRARRNAPISPVAAAQLIESLARAVHYAHTQGVIHRDLKPANVLLPRPALKDSSGSSNGDRSRGSASSESMSGNSSPLHPKITDFGLAKCLTDGDGEGTRSGAMLGTPAYMAPEQASGKSGYTGPATDVYALGAILYEMLTGQPPFRGGTWLETLEQVRLREPVRPGKLVKQLPRDLQTICLKCLEKDPARRYASAEALADDVRRFLHGEPIEAEPVGTGERLVKWARRRPAVATLACCTMLASVLGFAGVFWQWREAEHRRAIAEGALDDAYRARRAAQLRQREAVLQRQEAEQARMLVEAEQQKAIKRLYLQRIAVAHSEWKNHQVVAANQVLDDCSVELRHWEWGYLKQLCDGSIQSMRGHNDVVWKVAYSPDGIHVASGSGQWGIGTHGEVILWDTRTGKPKYQPLRGHQGPIMGLAFSPDGKTLVSTSIAWERGSQGRVIAWDVEAGAEKYRLPLPYGEGGYGVAFAPDGQTFAVAHWKPEPAVRLWNAADGTPASLPFLGHKNIVFEVAFSPDGKRLASVGRDGVCFIWDVASRSVIHEFNRHTDLRNVRFSPDGRHLVYSNYGQLIYVWDVTQIPPVPVATHLNRGEIISGLDFSPEGRRLAVCARDGSIRVIDVIFGHENTSLRVHNGPVYAVAFSPDGTQLVTAGMDRVVRVSDVRVERERGADLIRPNQAHYYSLAFSPDSRLLYLPGGYNRTHGGAGKPSLTLWNVANSRVEHEFGHPPGWLSDVARNADGTRLVTASSDKIARVWDATTKQLVTQFTRHRAGLTSVAVSPDGQEASTTSEDGETRSWNIETGEELVTRAEHAGGVHCVAYSADGQWLATGGRDGRVKLWRRGEASSAATLEGHSDAVTRVMFSPRTDEPLLASASRDNTIRFWNPTTGQPLHVLRGHLGAVTGVAFSPDGRRLASSSEDWTVKLWDVDSGESILTFADHTWLVLSVAFSPDGTQIAMASETGVHILDAKPRAPWPMELKAYRDANLDWHRKAFTECERVQGWVAAKFHGRALAHAYPDSARYLSQYAYVAARAGPAEESERAYQHALQCMERKGDGLFAAVLLALVCDRQDDYRRLCARSLQKVGENPRLTAINEALWNGALGRTTEVNLAPLVESLEDKLSTASGADAATYLNTLGLAYQRLGRHAEAIAALDRSIATRDGVGLVEDWLIMALAHASAGQLAEARQRLAQSLHYLQEWTANPTVDRLTDEHRWFFVAQRDLLLREAQEAVRQLEAKP